MIAYALHWITSNFPVSLCSEPRRHGRARQALNDDTYAQVLPDFSNLLEFFPFSSCSSGELL